MTQTNTTSTKEPTMTTQIIISGKNGQLTCNPRAQGHDDAALLTPAGYDLSGISQASIENDGDIWTVPCDPLESADSAAVAYECACAYMGADWEYPEHLLSTSEYMDLIQHVLDGECR